MPTSNTPTTRPQIKPLTRPMPSSIGLAFSKSNKGNRRKNPGVKFPGKAPMPVPAIPKPIDVPTTVARALNNVI